MGALLVELIDNAVEVGIACAESAREPISAARGDRLAIRNHVKLAGVARSNHGFNAETVLDQGREPRDLRAIVVSGGAMDDFNFHGFSPSGIGGKYTTEAGELAVSGRSTPKRCGASLPSDTAAG